MKWTSVMERGRNSSNSCCNLSKHKQYRCGQTNPVSSSYKTFNVTTSLHVHAKAGLWLLVFYLPSMPHIFRDAPACEKWCQWWPMSQWKGPCSPLWVLNQTQNNTIQPELEIQKLQEFWRLHTKIGHFLLKKSLCFGGEQLLCLDFTAVSEKGKPTVYNLAPAK